jgi:hypothetical protein
LDINNNGTYDADTDIEYTKQTDKWSFSDNTLYLNGFEWETSAEVALAIVGTTPINLDVTGTNTFTSLYNGSNSTHGIRLGTTLTLTGSGSLYATGGTNTTGNSYGINNNLNVNITGRGTVTAKGNTQAVGGTVTTPLPAYFYRTNTTTSDPGNAANITVPPGTPFSNSSSVRFVEIYGTAGYWSCTPASGTQAHSFMLNYYCEYIQDMLTAVTEGLSVRCVK